MTAPAPRRNGPDAASVTVEPGAHATPGGTATLRLHARNLAPQTRDLQLRVIGLEETWRPATGIVTAVAADETASVELALTPPAGAAPGDYPFLVVIESGTAGSWTGRTVADAVLRVDGASDVVLSIEPAEVRGVRRKRVDIVVGNRGMSATEVALAPLGDAALDVDIAETSVLLQPAQTVRVPARLRAPVRLVGPHQRLPYQVVATGRAAPRRAQGSFTSRAVLGSGALRVAAVVAVMALWITAVVIALPRISERFTQNDPGPTAAQGPSDEGSGAAEQDGDTAEPDGGSDDGSDAGGGDTSADRGAGQVRVSGLVTGADPGDVRIEVVPTSSLWSTGMPTDTGTRVATTPGKVAAAAMPMAPVGSTQRVSTRTNDSGVWALSGLSTSARYLLTMSKPGFGTQRVVMTGAELAAAPLEVAMEAGEGSMAGLVSGPDGPAGGVEVTLTDGTTTVTTRTATTGAVGRWQVDGLMTPSTYLVSAASPDLGTESQLISLAAAGSREVDLSLDAGVAGISGRVVGVDSLGGTGGLGGITVVATNGTTTRTATTITGEDAGRFLLPRLPVPGSYTVTVSGAGYSTVTREVNLTSSGVSGWTISLTSAGGAVTGTVTDEDGAGIAAAGLVLTHGSGTATIYKTMSASDASGTFRFSGVAPGTYVLSAEAFGHETTYAEVVVRAGGVAEVDLVLRRIPGDGLVATASITGRVVDASTGGQITCPILMEGQDCLVTASVIAEDVEGVSRTITSTAEPDDPYRLPATGASVNGLLPGRYVVTLTAPGYEPGTVTVTVPMGAEAEAADVALEPSPSLTGAVLPRTGLLPDGVCVVARLTGTPEIADPCGQEVPACATATARCAAVADDGTYRMDRLSAGAYTVTVEGLSGGYVTPAPQLLNLLPGEIRRYDVVVERNGIISVSAALSNGAGSTSPADAYFVRAETQDGQRVGDPVQLNSSGFAQVTNLPPDTYRIVGTQFQNSEPLASAIVEIGLNQEIRIQLILASAVESVPAYVGTQLSSGATQPVAGATITINGVIGYEGTAPQRGEQTFVTGSDGRVDICTANAPDCTAWMPLVEGIVNVTIVADDFDEFTATGVPLSSLANVLLTPTAQPFSGRVALVPDVADTSVLEDVRFEVVTAPPGVISPSLRAGSDGEVVYTDQALATNEIRPGRYTIVAHLDGYSSATQTFEVGIGGGITPPPSWNLLRQARVGVVPVLPGDPPVQVPGAVITLHTPDGERIERTASATQTVLDFGTLPSGQYEVDVRIAGYEPVLERPLTVPPGAVISNPLPVQVVRLGSITGVVQSEFAPGWWEALPGAEVTAISDDATGTFTATSGSNGTYLVTGTLDQPGLRNGEWDLTATADDHEQVEGAENVSVNVQQGQTVEADPLNLAPGLGGLLLTVTDGDEPVGNLNARLLFSDANHPQGHRPCVEGSDQCQTDAALGIYHFTDVLPLTYTLFLSGGGYMPLSTSVDVPAGETVDLLVPITAPTGSIQGHVRQTLIDGSTAPLPGSELLQVVLRQGNTGIGTSEIDDAGAYLLEDLGAGSYTVELQERSSAGAPWSPLTSTTVTVLSGQSAVVDLVVPLISRPVTVEVTSVNGTDLAGGLVTMVGMVDGEEVTLGPQPLARAGAGFSATFLQVPVGTWQASVSGPAGHHGSYRGEEVEITATSDDAVTTSVTVAETELRLQVVPPTEGDDPPGQVVVTASPGTVPGNISADPVQATLITGAGDSVLYLPAIGWTLTVADPGGGWSATISPATVPAAARTLARVSLEPADDTETQTVLGELPSSITAGDPLDVIVSVTSGGSAAVGGEVTVQHRPEGSSTWIDEVPVPLGAGGVASVTLETAEWEAGDYQVRAVYEAPTGSTDSTSGPTTIEVLAPEGGGDEPPPEGEPEG